MTFSVLIATMHIGALPWDCLLILMVLAVLLPWRGTARIRKLLARPVLTPSDRLYSYASTIAFQWIAVAITAWRTRAHGWSLASLGLIMRNPALALSVGAAVAAILALTQLLSLRVLARTPSAQHGIPYQMLRKLMPQSSSEILPFLVLVGTVSICEEFLYRGFVFASLAVIFRGSMTAAVFGSAALFAIGHLYQGRPGITMTFILGLIFASIRVWTGTLIPCVIVHLVVDSIAGIVGPQLLQRADSLRTEAGPPGHNTGRTATNASIII
jgi:uncharacterized protein